MTLAPARHPADTPAFLVNGESVAWGAWAGRIDATARKLAMQAPRGGVVAVVAEDVVETAALVLGALRAGVALLPLSPRLPEGAREEVRARAGAVWRGSGRADPDSVPAAVRGQGAVVVTTSGSMGAPKPALLTADALMASAVGVNEALGFDNDGRWLLDLPLSHVGGLGVVVRCALAGGAFVIPTRGTTTHDALAGLAPTHASLVSTQLYRLLQQGEARYPALRAVLMGGSAMPPNLIGAAVERRLPVCTSYGLTEMGSTVTATRPGEGAEALATSGRALAGREVRVVEGEILVGGAPLFAGYLADGRLDRPEVENGLFPTGDLGALDAAGRLRVAGRRDNRFVSGGENVQPEEVEAALAALPGVVRAVVVAVPDPEWGRRGVAFVEVEGGGAPDGARLAAALAERLPRYKVPARFLRWPVGEAGFKPSRAALSRLAADA